MPIDPTDATAAALDPSGTADPESSSGLSEVERELQGLVGEVIAERYRVDAVLGVGGMGAVFRCHHLGLLRDVAVKVLHAEMSRHEEVAVRFAREAQSASRLDHPNCVRVFDFGRWSLADGRPPMQYMAMELLEGRELASMFDGTALDPARAVELTLQIVRGLQHAHERGIVHRDLKPENVFITTDHKGDELLKIVDFGIAKIVSGDGANDNMTKAGFIFGTPRYMSPEQCAGGDIDARTDIYAAGVILYQMLTGHPPFDDEDIIAIVRMHMTAPVPALPDSVPSELAEIVYGMLEKERAKRIGDAATLRERLEQVNATPASEDTVVPPGSPVAAERAYTAEVLLDVTRRSGTLMAEASKTGLARLTQWAKKKPKWAAAGALGVAGLLGMASMGGDEAESTPASPGVEETSWLGGVFGGAPTLEGSTPDEVLEEVDTLIRAGAHKVGLDRVRALIDEHPDDVRLVIRKGRLLMHLEDQAASALEAYADAVERAPAILEDEQILGELQSLMRRPEVRAAALDLAIRKLGEHGKGFLIERVDDDENVLGYVDRHRALEKLEELGAADEVDVKLNVALDLWQAQDSPEPCKTYGDALTAIEEDPDVYYLGSVMRTSPPSPPRGADSLQAAVCGVLPARLEALRSTLTERYPIPKAQWTVPKAYSSKSRKKRRRGGVLRRIFR